jgi:hypothetical protein
MGEKMGGMDAMWDQQPENSRYLPNIHHHVCVKIN